MPKNLHTTDERWPEVPSVLMELIFNFCFEHGFNKAANCLRSETNRRVNQPFDVPCPWTNAARGHPSLVEWWKASCKKDGTSKSESNSSSDSSSDSSSESESESESESKPKSQTMPTPKPKAEPQETPKAHPPKPSLKRNAAELSHSSSDSNDSESDSDSELDSKTKIATTLKDKAQVAKTQTAQPPFKRKAHEISDSSSDGDSSNSESGSDSESVPDTKPAAKKAKLDSAQNSKAIEVVRDLDSCSSSSDSDSEPDIKVKVPTKITPPIKSLVDVEAQELDAESESSEDSESDSSSSESDSSDSSESESNLKADPDTDNQKKLLIPSSDYFNSKTPKRGSVSDSSATLAHPSPVFQETPLPKEETKPKKKKEANEIFQRVKAEEPVDSRFASNAYQSYEFADKAYRDLSVTKGKDFTKEKNKKKRGSYRGGAIDSQGIKSIKFES